MFLFLNKKDLMETELRTNDLGALFPEYTDGPDVRKAISFIQGRFQAIFREERDPGEILHVVILSACARAEVRDSLKEVSKVLFGNRTSRRSSLRIFPAAPSREPPPGCCGKVVHTPRSESGKEMSVPSRQAAK
jgi:hypothetical protein